MLFRYIQFLQRHAVFAVLVIFVVLASAAAGVSRLEIDTSFDMFMPGHSDRLAVLEHMRESFGDGEQIIVLQSIGETDTVLPQLIAIERELTRIDGVVTAQAPSAARTVLDHHPEVPGETGTIEHNERVFALFRITLNPLFDYAATIRDIRSVFARTGSEVAISGEPYLQSEVANYAIQIISRLPPIALFLILIVFRVRIGSWLATLLALTPAVTAAIVTMGFIGWSVGSVSIISALVPVFVIVIGSADGLHVACHVLDLLDSGESIEAAVVSTLQAVGRAVIITTLTTMAGFWSLSLINSDAIRQLGFAAAAGVFVAGIATWSVLPVCLLLVRTEHLRRSSMVRNRFTGILERMRGVFAIGLASILVLAFVPGLIMLQAGFSMTDLYRPTTEIRKDLDRISEILGGAIPVYVTFSEGSDREPDLAEAVLTLQDRAESLSVAGRSISAFSITRDALQEAGIDAPTGRVHTDAAQFIPQQFQDAFRQVSDTFTAPNGLGRAVFFLRNLENETLSEFERLASSVSADYNVLVEPAGTAFVMKEMNDQIIGQQLWALVSAIAVAFLLIAVAERSIAAGVLSSLPVIITLVVVFGVMGYVGIQVSVITSIITGLTIGVGIDYSIHYVSMYRYERRNRSQSPEIAALGYVATPVLANALGLAIGFTAMAFSPLKIHVTLSILMWVSMTVSALISLTLLPTIAGFLMRRAVATGYIAKEKSDT